MATSAFLLYTNANGDLRGTQIDRMGGHVPEQLQERFKGDFEALTKFIEVGAIRGGYRLATDEGPRWDDDEDVYPANIAEANSSDYVFHVLPDFTFQSVNLKAVTVYSLEVL
jgi:hypothetical protein